MTAGQPLFSTDQEMVGHLSLPSSTPSPSLSLFPVTVITRFDCTVLPLLSVIVTVTVYVPGVVYV
jgi:hypothetical protein